MHNPSSHPIARRAASTSVAAALLTALAPAALAQTPPAPPPQPADNAPAPATKGRSEAVKTPDAAAARPEGWTPGIAFGASLNLVDTRSVVGQMDGTTINFSAALDAALDFNEGIHEWRNSLKAGAGVTRTPSLDEFVKTSDGLSFETIYLAHLVEIFGPYARASFNTTMFPGMDIRPAAVTYSVANLDGTTTQYIGRRLALTDAFQPFSLREGVGVFVQPVKRDEITFEGKAGIGAQENIASGYAVSDDAATPVIEVKELDFSYAIGAEAIANAWGFMDPGKRVSYSVGAGVLFPFKTSDLAVDDDRGLIDLVSVEGHVGLNVKLFDWASFGYKLSVLREPLILDEWQVSNNLLLTIGAAFGSKAPAPPAPPPPPPPCECDKKPEPPAKVEGASPPPAAPPAEAPKPADAPKPAEPPPAPAPQP